MTKFWNYYNTNANFHAFVQGLLAAITATLVTISATWNTGFPDTKVAFLALGAGILRAVIAYLIRWAATNVATTNLTMTPK